MQCFSVGQSVTTELVLHIMCLCYLSNLGAKKWGRRKFVCGVGESLLVVKGKRGREGENSTSIVGDLVVFIHRPSRRGW